MAPEFVVLNKYLMTLFRIRRHLTGQKGRHKWPRAYVPIKVRIQIDQLRSFAAHQLPDGTKRTKLLHVTGLDPSHWLLNTPTVATINREVRLLLKAMHGRRRTDRRRMMATTYRNREQALKERKYRQFISALVGKQKIPFDMDRICNLDGEME